jgi:hypothetical protein
VLCVLTSGTQAFAADVQIELKDLNLKLTIPSGWYTITRDTPSSDSVFAQIGSNGAIFLDYINQHSIYLDALNLSPFSEIVVTKVENNDIKSLYDLNSLSDAQRDSFARELMNSQSARDAGITYTAYVLYSHTQVKFVVMDLVQSASGGTSYGRQYMTVVNGTMISFTMHSYDTAMTTDQQVLLKAVIDSVAFTKITSKPLNFGSLIGTVIAFAAAGIVIGLALVMRNRAKPIEAAATFKEHKKDEIVEDQTKDTTNLKNIDQNKF